MDVKISMFFEISKNSSGTAAEISMMEAIMANAAFFNLVLYSFFIITILILTVA
jgi:hypothetical protein